MNQLFGTRYLHKCEDDSHLLLDSKVLVDNHR